MTQEISLVGAARVRASELGLALWRNNSGACRDQRGRLVRFGLGNDSAALCKVWKSSDLIGLGIGGRLAAVEVKPAGWRYAGTERERAQAAFHECVRMLGGLAGFATTIDDVERILRGGR
jgi:hypothetical protein